LGFLLGRRRQTTDEARMDPRAAGAVSVAMLLVLMILTRDLWRQVPGIWIATTPGLLFCAVALNLAEGWMRPAVRSRTSAREAETTPHNPLPSALYPHPP